VLVFYKLPDFETIGTVVRLSDLYTGRLYSPLPKEIPLVLISVRS